MRTVTTVGTVALMLLPAATFAQERWSLREELKIGTVDGPAALSTVRVATISPDGRALYILQHIEQVIKVFDTRTGGLIRTIGRAGSGPGEFRGLQRLGWRGDTLLATDNRLSRISWFTAGGEHIRTRQVVPVGVGRHTVGAARLAPDDKIWAEPLQTNLMAVANGLISDLPLRILDADGRVATVVADLDIRGSVLAVNYGTGGAVFRKPLTPWPIWKYDEDGASVAIMLPRTTPPNSSTFVVTRIRSDGSVIYRREYRYSPDPVSSAARDSIYRDYAGLFTRGGNSATRALAEARKHVPIPSTYPAVSDMFHLRSGHIWLLTQPVTGHSATWLVLAPDGDIVARVRAPSNARLLAADARHAWGVVLDEMDVPYVIRYAIVVER